MILMKSIESQALRHFSSSTASASSSAADIRVHSIVFALTGLFFLCVDGCAFSQCYEPLRRAIGSVDHQPVLPFYEDKELDMLCLVYTETEQCASFPIGECSPSERVNVQGLDLAIHVLCNDSYEAYRRQRHCFISQAVIDIASVCNTTYTTQLSNLHRGSKTILQKTSLLCSHVDELVTCVRDGVTAKCGSEAGQLIHSLKTSIQRPVKEGMGCANVTDAIVYEPPIVFIVIVCSLLSVVIVLVTAIVHRRIKSSRSNTRGSSSSSSSRNGCCGGWRLRSFEHHFHRSGRLQLMESKTTGADVSRSMKISSVESESTATLQGASVVERESTALSKPLLKPRDLGTVSESDDKK